MRIFHVAFYHVFRPIIAIIVFAFHWSYVQYFFFSDSNFKSLFFIHIKMFLVIEFKETKIPKSMWKKSPIKRLLKWNTRRVSQLLCARAHNSIQQQLAEQSWDEATMTDSHKTGTKNVFLINYPSPGKLVASCSSTCDRRPHRARNTRLHALACQRCLLSFNYIRTII